MTSLRHRWDALSNDPVARRWRPWADRLLTAAHDSLACGLEAQAVRLLERVDATLTKLAAQAPGRVRASVALEATWSSEGLPTAPTPEREAEVWRKVRAMHVRRQPYQGEHHPERLGLAWGPYNRQSAVADALIAASQGDPLWVDDFVERERAMIAIDLALGG